MATVTIPNTFANGTPADATEVNANFDAITAQVNGGIDDDNVDAISEGNVTFNDSTGHTHSGAGNDGTNIPEAGVTFNITTGHTHSGGDSKLVALAGNGTDKQGGVRFETGTSTSIVGVQKSIAFATTFTQPPVVSACPDATYGDANSYWSVFDVTASGFKVITNIGAVAFTWTAIGI